VTIVSYNVWELYDGIGEGRYLSHEAHGGSPPSKQYPLRLAALGRALSAVEADVLVLQEVEGAGVACALAAAAWPGSGWSCYGARGSSSGMPQNVAVATRLEGTARVLRPADLRASGPRPALELSLAGTDGLTVTGLHLKSSRGQSSHDDCENARRRMGMSAALATRYQGWSSVLLVGDFNVDPLDSASALYDRTDDILTARGWSRLCPTKGGCPVATWRGARGAGSSIDLAFFRGGGRWRPGPVKVLASAPHVSRTTLGSDHLPLVVDLER
jgi:endonuclease/exonuclease/phosphatase family metal-dependent hydrolase